MCQIWLIVLTLEIRTLWGIPQDRYSELGVHFGEALAILQKAKNKEERTPVINEQCREIFGTLEGTMRFFKKHYFLVPPLAPSDIIRLGLALPHPSSPIPRPYNQVEADLGFPGLHMVELRNIRPVAGIPPDPRSDYGVRIHFGLTGTPTDRFRFRLTQPPKSGNDLPYSIFSRRKKEGFDLDGESGNTIYFCLRYENSKGREEGQGPFGPIIFAVIP
jgi:hypothetical protein